MAFSGVYVDFIFALQRGILGTIENPIQSNLVLHHFTGNLSHLLLPETPPPRVVQTERILARLQLARNLLRLVFVAILIVTPDLLQPLVLLARHGAEDGACAAPDAVRERLCDCFDADADGPQDGVEAFAEGIADVGEEF